MIIHIGYVKTASTFLQKEFFVEKNGFIQVGTHDIYRDYLTKPNELVYDKNVFYNLIKADIDNANSKGLEPVISFERLSGNPLSGGYDQAIVARRLHELFPNAKIIIIFREQVAFLVSVYRQLVREGLPGSFTAFIKPPMGSKIPLFDINYLFYINAIKYYIDLFKKENVEALPYELLLKDKDMFFNKISQLQSKQVSYNVNIGKRVNEADRYIEIWVKSFTNAFFVKDQTNPYPIFESRFMDKLAKKIARLMPTVLDKKIRSKYEKIANGISEKRLLIHNEELSELLNIDLQSLGYKVSDKK